MNLQVPDAMPTLSRGSHNPGDGKACVMEYVSLISGDRWTDKPTCTHPAIRDVAIYVNDTIKDDDERSRLLVPLIGRLIDCSVRTEEVMDALYAVSQQFRPEGEVSPYCPCGCGLQMSTFAYNFFTTDPRHHHISITTAALVRTSPFLPTRGGGESALPFLVALLDAYDEVTGRTPRTVEPEVLGSTAEKLVVAEPEAPSLPDGWSVPVGGLPVHLWVPATVSYGDGAKPLVPV